MIINIRGTNGSGKTWIVFKLIERLGGEPILDLTDNKPIGHVVGRHASAVGKYNRDAPSGSGCDSIKYDSQEIIARRLIAWSAGGSHVIFEGLIVSGIYGRWRDFAQEPDRDFRWVFLDTSLEQCIENVRARRTLAGKPAEFNTENLTSKYNAVKQVYRKAWGDKLQTYHGSSDEMLELVEGWIK